MHALLALTLLQTAQVTSEPVREPQLIGEVFRPKAEAKRRPGILVLHGSEGGIFYSRFTAQGLAREGYVSLAIQYFGGPGQPKHLVEAPLDTCTKAVDWLQKQDGVDPERIFVVGFSRGAEAALIYATLDKRIKKVVAVAPTCMRFQGFIDMNTPCTQSAFSFGGKPIPAAGIRFDGRPLETLYREALASPANASNFIESERTNGPILLISGGKDNVWPSAMLAERLVARLRAKKFRHEVRWENYANAGHMLVTPPGTFQVGGYVPTEFGGTKNGTSFALLDGWKQMAKFLAQ